MKSPCLGPSLSIVIALVVGSMAGCARGEDPNYDSGPGGGDGGGIDAARVDGAGGDTGGTSCAQSMDCRIGAARICDQTLHRCVECIPTMDMCASGMVCDPMTRACVQGCRSGVDCTSGSGGSDAGISLDGSVPDIGRRQCLVGERRCVQCLTNDHCPAGSICTGNMCVNGCTASRLCPSGLSCCSGVCVNTQSDSRSCGACGRACDAASACCNGMCANLATDAMNCGACARPCAPPNATGRCMASMCGILTCLPGFADSDGMASNGCECTTGANAATCDVAVDPGMIARGAMRSLTGSLRMPGQDHWFRVQFAAGGMASIRLTVNPGMAYRFDVQPACTGSVVMCPNQTAGGAGLTAWEFQDDAPMPMGGTMRMTPYPTTLMVHVRTSVTSTACTPYTIVVSN